MNIIESIMISYLKEHTQVPVYATLPEDVALPCIVIEKTAGGYSETLLSATVAVQSYDLTLEKAAQLNDTVKWLLLDGFANLTQILKISLNSDYNFTDTSTERYRYQAVYDITYYRKDN